MESTRFKVGQRWERVSPELSDRYWSKIIHVHGDTIVWEDDAGAPHLCEVGDFAHDHPRLWSEKPAVLPPTPAEGQVWITPQGPVRLSAPIHRLFDCIWLGLPQERWQVTAGYVVLRFTYDPIASAREAAPLWAQNTSLRASNDEKQAALEIYGRAIDKLLPGFRVNGSVVERVTKIVSALVEQAEERDGKLLGTQAELDGTQAELDEVAEQLEALTKAARAAHGTWVDAGGLGGADVMSALGRALKDAEESVAIKHEARAERTTEIENAIYGATFALHLKDDATDAFDEAPRDGYSSRTKAVLTDARNRALAAVEWHRAAVKPR